MTVESRDDYQSFIDWMKCLGIIIIVIGHVCGSAINLKTPPIYPKQFGVAFFLFVMGYGLSRTKKSLLCVLWDRLFDIYLIGLSVALLISLIKWPLLGTLNLSNYLPFLLGSNVIFNNFPANPTTWYIGTYIHFLLLWAFVFRKFTVTPTLLCLFAVLEMAIRAILMFCAGGYIAYMLVPNWLTVFMMGSLYGKSPCNGPTKYRMVYFVSLFLLPIMWFFVSGFWGFDWSFPYRHVHGASTFWYLGAVSGMATFLYLTITWLVFKVTYNLPAPIWVRFFSRNTLFIFIAHMPLFYLLDPVLKANPWVGMLHLYPIANIFIELIALAFVSEFIMLFIKPSLLRQSIYRKLQTSNLFAT